MLTSSTNPSMFGQSVTFTATVTVAAPGAGTPTGTVTFMDGATTLGTGTLNAAGVATLHDRDAVGRPSQRHRGLRRRRELQREHVADRRPDRADQADTTTALTSSTNPSVFGQSVTFTATVTVQRAGGRHADRDGDVLRRRDDARHGHAERGGVATFTTATLSVGSQRSRRSTAAMRASPRARRTPWTRRSRRRPRRRCSTSSTNPSMFGQSVTFTATVTVRGAGRRHATGTVTFHGRGDDAGHGHAQRVGVATFTTATLAVGHHTITAVYGGDASFNASTSTTVDQEVQKADTTTALTSSTNPSKVGQSVTFTATVTVRGAGGRHGDRDGDVHRRRRRRWARARSTARGRDVHDLRRWRWAITPSRRPTAAMRASTEARRLAWTRRCRRRTRRRHAHVLGEPVEVRPVGHVHRDASRQSPRARERPPGSVEFFDGATSLGTSTLNGSGHASLRDVDADRRHAQHHGEVSRQQQLQREHLERARSGSAEGGHDDRPDIVGESVEVRTVGDVHRDGDGGRRRVPARRPGR